MQGFNILVNGQIEMEVLICSQKTIKKQQSQKMEPKHQRFTIKKFSVGVASVLIGTTFAVHRTNSVLADQTNTEPGTEMVETAAEDPGDTLAATEEANNENGAPVEDATTNETPQAETPMTDSNETTEAPTSEDVTITNDSTIVPETPEVADTPETTPEVTDTTQTTEAPAETETLFLLQYCPLFFQEPLHSL